MCFSLIISLPICVSRLKERACRNEPVGLMSQDSSNYTMTSIDSTSMVVSTDPPSVPIGSRTNCAKSIIDRKLRKFASETSFATTETASESSVEKEKEREVPTRTRVFTVKPVARLNGIGKRVRHDSEASNSNGSEATVASGANTPIGKKAHFCKRPKSMSEMNTSFTSATIHSLESQVLIPHVEGDGRRASNVYVLDDDSVHEFDDDQNGNYLLYGTNFPFAHCSDHWISIN